MPASLLGAVQTARRAWGATMTNGECVALLNSVAWMHRADGWGLSLKPNGNHGMRHDGKPCAVDVLYHQPSRTVWDVLRAAGEVSEPTWIPITTYDFAGRPWVSPIDPIPVLPIPAPVPLPVPVPPTVESDAILTLTHRLDTVANVLETLSQRIAALEHVRYAIRLDPNAPSLGTSREWQHAHALKLTVEKIP